MRWMKCWLMGCCLAASLRAELPEPRQQVSLEGASIRAFVAGNIRRVEVRFASRAVITQERTDHMDATPMEILFGQSKAEAPLFLNGKKVAAVFQQPLTQPAWLIDGVGDGFYLPGQPGLKVSNAPDPAAFRLENETNRSLQFEFGKVSVDDLNRIAGLMENPVAAPLQITENDDSALIVYDLATRTTAYVIVRSSERMNSAGYLSGSAQPCLVLIRSTANGLELASGNFQPGAIRLKLFGDWTPSADEENVLRCEQKAGRTWIEFSAGSAPIHLVKMPEKSYLERILSLFKK